MVTPRGPTTGSKLFLAAVNTTDFEDAVEWTVDNLYKPGDTLFFFHVVPHAQAVYSGVFLPPSLEELDQKVRITEDALRSRLEPICKQHGINFELEVVKAGGDSSAIGELCAARAAEVDARAVVVCPHDKGRAVRFFVGSVAEHLVKHCSIPVVVVHHQGSNAKRIGSMALLGALAEAED